MKILQITKRYNPYVGGIEQVTEDIASSFENAEQRIICFNHEKGTKREKVNGVEVVRVNCPVIIASQPIAIGYKKVLKEEIKDFKPDIVIFHYPNPFASHFLLKYLKKKTFKLITYYHADIVKQKFLKIFFNRQTNKLLSSSEIVVATSPNYIGDSEFLSKYKNKCVVIPNCVNTDRLKGVNEKLVNQIKEKYKNKCLCFAVGRHVPYKGMEYLIRASKYLDERFQIVIGGSGPLTNKLKELAKGDNKVEFVGRIEPELLKSYFQTCDIFCFPSITKNEAFGIALAEAMYYGKPSITFTIPGSGVNYVNIKNETGLEVENSNYEEYAKAIIKLYENKELREKYGTNAKARVEKLFTLNSFKENINSLVDKITSK